MRRLLVALALVGCGSAAQANLPIQTIPQNVTLTLDASDGGTITIGSCASQPQGAGDCGGQVWLDARGGGADSANDQQGQDIDTALDTRLHVPISTGPATGAPTPP